MSIYSFNVSTTGLTGNQVNPRRVTMTTDSSADDITTSGFLNNINQFSGTPILTTDIFEIIYDFDPNTNNGTFGIFTVSFNASTGFSLIQWVNPGNVAFPVSDGHLASFKGTDGQIQDADLSASELVLLSAVNRMSLGGQMVLDKGTGTVNAGSVTIDRQSGVITAAVTTAAGSSTTFTLHNIVVETTSVLHVTLMGGTNTTIGVELSASISSNGIAVITISNNNASAALNGNLIIGFSVF